MFRKVGQEERKNINDIFKKFDKNLDGFIEKTELIEAFKERE